MGQIGRFALGGFVALQSVAMILGGTTIPLWAIGVVGIAAAIAIFIGK
jgi:hypothetical protein